MDELERLAAEAAVVEADDAANQPVMPGQEPAPVIDPAQEWRDLARFGADLVLAPVPELRTEWSPERIDALGMALARCAEHYGWTTGGIIGHPLAGLAIATWPLAIPVVRMVKAQKAAKNADDRSIATAGQVPADVPPAAAGEGIQIVLGGG